MYSAEFRRFLSWNAAIGQEKQHNLYDEVGDADWEADLDAGVLTLGDRTFSVQVLGSESEVSNSWLWAWANSASDLPEPVVRLARQLRVDEETSSIEEYTSPQFSLGVVDGFALSIATSGHLGRSGAVYRGPYEAGAAFFYIPDGLTLGPPSAERVIDVFINVTQTWEVDAELLIDGYAAGRGLVLEKDRHWLLHVPRAEGNETVRFRFDDERRIIEYKARPAG